MSQKQLFIFSTTPYGDKQGLETLDALLISASFDNQVSVLFVDDGIFQLLSGQNVIPSGRKAYTKTFGALADFELNQIYIDRTSAKARGVDIGQLDIQAQMLDSLEVANMIAQQDRVFHF